MSSSVCHSCPYSLDLFFVIVILPSKVLSSTLANPPASALSEERSCLEFVLYPVYWVLLLLGIYWNIIFFFFFFFSSSSSSSSFFFLPCVRLIPLLIFSSPPGPLTFFLHSRLSYQFCFLSYCIYFPKCLRFNLSKTKPILLYIRNQSVPRIKHFLPRL